MSAPPQSVLQTETEERLRFEMLLADVCAQFVNVAACDVDSKIENAQRVICESLRMDQSSVWQVSNENPDLLVMTHVYRDPNLKPLPSRPSAKGYFPWGYNKILNKQIVCVPNTATLPPEAAKDKESWEQYGIHSSLIIPLSVGGGSVIGVLAFDSEKEHDWPEPLQRRLQILAHVFAQALDRKRAEQKRKMAEDRLREYEEAVEGLEEMVVVVDREYRYLIANRKFLNVRHMTREQVEGRFANEVLNKGVFEAVIKEKLDECFRGNVVRFEMKYTYPELGVRDVSVSYFPIAGKTGVDRVACIFQDITERKLAEAALANVSRKLIEAQEQERIRIGRELHDDIGQRLALLAVQLQQLHEDTLILPEVRNRMGELNKEVSEIATDIQSLSHELHSAKLQYLGLAAAMRGFCQEFAEQQKVEIDFKAHDLPSPLSPDISLCLFRVLQEALHNSAKHSGVRQFEVRFWGTSDEIHLTVKDSGAGFDREAAKESRGLGLISMEERLKLVKGTLSINSQPKRGTTIHARMPLSSGGDSMRAAG